jgi:RND superfamily putative drug exporter
MTLGVLLDTFLVRPFVLPLLLLAIGDSSMWPRRPATSVPAGS